MRIGLRKRTKPDVNPLDLWDGTLPVDVYGLVESLGVEVRFGECGGGRLAEAEGDTLIVKGSLPPKKARVVCAFAFIRYLRGDYLFEVDGTEGEALVAEAKKLLIPEPTVGLSSFEVSDLYDVPLGWAS